MIYFLDVDQVVLTIESLLNVPRLMHEVAFGDSEFLEVAVLTLNLLHNAVVIRITNIKVHR